MEGKSIAWLLGSEPVLNVSARAKTLSLLHFKATSLVCSRVQPNCDILPHILTLFQCGWKVLALWNASAWCNNAPGVKRRAASFVLTEGNLKPIKF